jgi:flagellar hook-associated protein 3 FlgL
MIDTSHLLGLLAPKDHGAPIRARIDTLAAELSSGRRADLGAALRSDFSRLSMQAHALRTFEARDNVLQDAAAWGEAGQAALSAIADGMTRIGEAGPAALHGGGEDETALLGQTAEGVLRDARAALDVRSGGRAVFGRGTSDDMALPSVGDMLATLRANVAGAGDADDVAAVVDSYFGPTGPWQAAVAALPGEHVAFRPAPGEAFTYRMDAGSDAVVDALKAAAFAAILSEAGLSSDELANSASSHLQTATMEGRNGVVLLQGHVGSVEGRVGDRLDRLGAERSRQEMALADGVTADANETAIRLQAEITRLETTYAVTARRANLSLTGYLR